MFWRSVAGGLGVLAHWEVWLAAAIYVAGIAAFMISMGGVMGGRDASAPRTAVGCLGLAIGGPIVQGALMAMMIAFLMPIMLGGTDPTPPSILAAHAVGIVLAGVAGIIAGILISLIPIVGGLVNHIPSVLTFVEGVVIFRILAGSLIGDLVGDVAVDTNVYPGFWTSLGFLLVAGAFSFGALLFLALITGSLGEAGESITSIVAPAFGAVVGLIPVFMYASYVTHSVRALIAP